MNEVRDLANGIHAYFVAQFEHEVVKEIRHHVQPGEGLWAESWNNVLVEPEAVARLSRRLKIAGVTFPPFVSERGEGQVASVNALKGVSSPRLLDLSKEGDSLCFCRERLARSAAVRGPVSDVKSDASIAADTSLDVLSIRH